MLLKVNIVNQTMVYCQCLASNISDILQDCLGVVISKTDLSHAIERLYEWQLPWRLYRLLLQGVFCHFRLSNVNHDRAKTSGLF
jgi:hypothetical protein